MAMMILVSVGCVKATPAEPAEDPRVGRLRACLHRVPPPPTEADEVALRARLDALESCVKPFATAGNCRETTKAVVNDPIRPSPSSITAWCTLLTLCRSP